MRRPTRRWRRCAHPRRLWVPCRFCSPFLVTTRLVLAISTVVRGSSPNQWSHAGLLVPTSQRTGEAQGAYLVWRREGRLAVAFDRLPPGGMTDLLRAEMALEAGEIAEAWTAVVAATDHPLFAEGAGYRSIYLGVRCRVLLARGGLPAAQAACATWREAFDAASAVDLGAQRLFSPRSAMHCSCWETVLCWSRLRPPSTPGRSSAGRPTAPAQTTRAA